MERFFQWISIVRIYSPIKKKHNNTNYNTMKKVLLSLLFAGLVTSLQAQDVSHKIEVTLLPYKKVTNGAFYQVITLASPNCYVEYLEGFDYEWGYEYKVRLKETTLAHPPEDGSSIEYKLLEVISKTPVSNDYTFPMLLSRDLYLGLGTDQVSNFKYINDSTFLYMDEINIQYGKDKTDLLDQIISKNKVVRAQFEFIDSKTIRLK